MSFIAKRSLIFGALALIALSILVSYGGGAALTGFYFLHQDQLLLATALAMVAIAIVFCKPRAAPLTLPNGWLWIVALVLCLVCVAGHWWILSGYDASRDEQMAKFDSIIFASGRLVQPLGGLWRDHADALNTTFLYPAEHRGAWVSAYLPLNAAIRALIGRIAVPELSNPLMTGLGALALWACARRLWPEDREAPWIALLLYCLSGQVMLAGMTAYAMPAHLTLDLVWLWLYLRGRRWSDGLALLVAFVAVGLHQPIMHPMFAAPILSLLVFRRQWARAALYLSGYALIGLFWLWWPTWMWHLVQSGASAVQPAGVDYISRLVQTVAGNGLAALPLMSLNLARFIAWNHVLLLPLAWIGLRLGKGQPVVRALAAGIALTFLVMTVILPYQGHGFGYRYLHGLIGSAILIAVQGWVSLRQERARWRSLLLWTSAGTALVVLPMQLFFAHQFYAPYARANAQIAAMDADYAVLVTSAVPFAQDLVLNRPDLGNRPIRLVGELVSAELVGKLCARHARVELVPTQTVRPIAALFRIGVDPQFAKRNAVLARRLGEAGCEVRQDAAPLPAS